MDTLKTVIQKLNPYFGGLKLTKKGLLWNGTLLCESSSPEILTAFLDGWLKARHFVSVENPVPAFLEQPLSPLQIRKSLREKDGRVEGIVCVDIDDCMDGGLETFDDIVSDLLISGEGMLSDIEYKVVGAFHGDMLVYVNGGVEFINDDDLEEDEE